MPLTDFWSCLVRLSLAQHPQTYSAELVGAPTGSVNTPLTTTLGTRAVRITASAPLSSGATVQLNWTATDQLVMGNIKAIENCSSISTQWAMD